MAVTITRPATTDLCVQHLTDDIAELAYELEDQGNEPGEVARTILTAVIDTLGQHYTHAIAQGAVRSALAAHA